MVDLIATKSLKYGTRRLLPDDSFEARSRRDARVLTAIGKARYAEEVPQDDLVALRAEYKAKMGKQPFHGWDADTLREKMAG